MNYKFLFFVPALAVALLSLYSCMENNKVHLSAQNNTISNDSLKRYGGYLVTITGCNDCHTPKKIGINGSELDSALLLSGYPSSRPVVPFPKADVAKGLIVVNYDVTRTFGPWGTTFAANISSDQTGIGSWTLERFSKAMRHGKFKGMDAARPIMPPMPWQNLKFLKDKDLEAIFIYLKSTKPIVNVVPAFIPANGS